jgi:hypothetical protein
MYFNLKTKIGRFVKQASVLFPCTRLRSVSEKEEVDGFIYDKDCRGINDYCTTFVGPNITDYQYLSDDQVLGLRPVADGKRFIGDSEVHIKSESFVIKGVAYKGGCMTLASLTEKIISENIKILPEDLEDYKLMLISTNSIHRNNDPLLLEQRSSGRLKHAVYVKAICDGLKRGRSQYISSPRTGERMLNDTQLSEQFVWKEDVG